MSSLVATRRGHAVGTTSANAGRLSSATRTAHSSTARTARPSRTVRRQPNAPEPSHALPAGIQRNRLVSAAIRSLDEVGYVNTSVAQISSRARVSRRTFYELFATREECMLAVFEDVVALIESDLAAAALEGLPWRERLRGGLWTILSFFEREPLMARVLVVHSLQGEAELLARREALLGRLAAIVDEGREQAGKAVQATPLTAEGLVGAVLAIVYTRLLRAEREPLTALLGELMGLIVLPYLGPAAARRERERPLPVKRTGQGERSTGESLESDPLEGVTMRLTYRTMRVLECVAAQPGASNRQVGVAAGVPDQGQMSKLLARLERLGLLVNTGKPRPKGEANAWELTEAGRRVAQVLAVGPAVGETSDALR
jgi:AcrR family transcriptional regulator